MANRSLRLDLRAVLPVAALAVVVLVIIFVELCGREDVVPDTLAPDQTPRATATPATPVPTVTPGPSPTPSAADATATAEAASGGEQRDGARWLDLAIIGEALEVYRQAEGSYPSTDDNVQTLCVFTDSDAGCALEEVLTLLPEDPLGDPVENGYWFRSTETEFTIFAQRESDRFEECPEHPEFLERIESLLCLQGPSAE